jgi:predicted TPR repeat methyltransferase
MLDYRNSHTEPAKGGEYHAKFTENPYRSMVWSMEREILDSIAGRWLGPETRHLDFACGTGRIIEHVKPKVMASTGVDVSEGMLAIARENMPGGDFVNADLTRSKPFGERKFGFITAFRFFANAQEELRKDAMSALADLLDPEGILVFNNHKNRHSFVYAVMGLLRKDQRDMTDSEAETLARGAGLEIVATHYIGVFPANDRLLPLPVPAILAFERGAARFPILGKVASNRIYVCRRRDAGKQVGAQ